MVSGMQVAFYQVVGIMVMMNKEPLGKKVVSVEMILFVIQMMPRQDNNA